MSVRPLVLYHADCDDGFCAAWIARGVLGPETETIAVRHEDPPPDVRDRNVWVLDFSYPRATLLEMKSKAAGLVVIDHHVTAQQELADLPFCVFDLKHSGAMLAWRYFFPYATGEPPWIVRYVEDRDLWRWALPESREVSAAVRSYPRDFAQWDSICTDRGIGEMAREGRAILRAQDILVGQICANAREVGLGPLLCGLGTHADIFQSEVGERLCEGRPFSLTWFQTKEGHWIYSLRSRPPLGIDVAALAKIHGGGGHPAAAGFRGPPPDEFLVFYGGGK